jgi:hypothetical protein
MSAARVAGHITSCLRKAEVAAERAAKQKRAAEEAEAARSDRQHVSLFDASCDTSLACPMHVSCSAADTGLHPIRAAHQMLCPCTRDAAP